MCMKRFFMYEEVSHVRSKNSVVRGLCVLGAESHIEEEDVLDGEIRVNPRVSLPTDAIAS